MEIFRTIHLLSSTLWRRQNIVIVDILLEQYPQFTSHAQCKMLLSTKHRPRGFIMVKKPGKPLTSLINYVIFLKRLDAKILIQIEWWTMTGKESRQFKYPYCRDLVRSGYAMEISPNKICVIDIPPVSIADKWNLMIVFIFVGPTVDDGSSTLEVIIIPIYQYSLWAVRHLDLELKRQILLILSLITNISTRILHSNLVHWNFHGIITNGIKTLKWS